MHLKGEFSVVIKGEVECFEVWLCDVLEALRPLVVNDSHENKSIIFKQGCPKLKLTYVKT